MQAALYTVLLLPPLRFRILKRICNRRNAVIKRALYGVDEIMRSFETVVKEADDCFRKRVSCAMR